MNKALKWIIWLVVIALVVVAIIGFQQGWFGGDDDLPHVALVQFAPHRALDAARDGFIAGLAEEGFVEGETVRFTRENAGGDRAMVNLLAQSIVDGDPDLVLSIATPTSIAFRNATEEIPIVITAVTEPLQVGNIATHDAPGGNITGTSDRTPVRRQFEFIQRVLPETQTIGIMYMQGETNAVTQADWAEEAALELGLTPLRFSVSEAAAVNQVAQTAATQVDVIYLPTCNTMAQAYAVIVDAADGAEIPVIAGEVGGVIAGALATEGIDYFELGKQTARMAARILRGEATPAEMAIEFQTEYTIAVNLVTAARLGIEIPEDIIAEAETVIREEDDE